MSRAAALREHDDTSNADDIVVLHDVSWEDYERLLEIRGDHSAPRISYLEGEVEIMSPSRDHEQIKSYIGHLLEAWCIDRGMDVSPFGSWTLKKKGQTRRRSRRVLHLWNGEAGTAATGDRRRVDAPRHRQTGDLPEAGRRRSLVLAQRLHRNLRSHREDIRPRAAQPPPSGSRRRAPRFDARSRLPHAGRARFQEGARRSVNRYASPLRIA